MTSQKGVCFKCQQPRHFAAQCPKWSLAIDDREIKEEEKRDLQEQTYDPPTNEYVDEKEEFDQLAMIKLPQPPTLDLGVVRCAIVQPVLSDDWRKTAILTTNILINEKPCKILIDSGSCVNAISRNTINRTGLKQFNIPSPTRFPGLTPLLC